MDALRKNSTTYDVLLIESNQKETEIYSELIKEVSSCKIDVMSRVASTMEWVARSNYHLVIIDSSGIDKEYSEYRKNRRTTDEFSLANQKIDGITLLERIKRVSPNTSVIIISELADVVSAVSAMRLGAEDYLKKPFDLEKFKLAVKRGLDRNQVFGGAQGATGYFNLLNSCQLISASMEQDKVFTTVKSYLTQELSTNFTAIYRLEDENPIRVDHDPEPEESDQALEEILEIAVYAANPFPKMTEADERDRFIDRGQLTPGLFVLRLRCVNSYDFFFVCLSPKRPINIDAFENRLRLLRRQVEVTGNNIREYMGVKQLVYVDDATGLGNTRYLNNILDREIANSNSKKTSFAVLFIDADHFKKVNDNHGHLTGTKLLNELGQHLKNHVRGSDTVFRYGGDEFVAVLSPSDFETASQVAERIRKAVEKRPFCESEKEGGLHFTVSIGVALYPDHAQSKKQVIEIADMAMYNAKKKSRNCVYVVPVPKKEGKVKPIRQKGTKNPPKKSKVSSA